MLVFLETPYGEYQGPTSARQVVLAGLGSTMGYWIGLALGWLEQGFPLDVEIVEILRKVADTNSYAQRIRHRSAALAKRWIREGD